MVHLIYKDILLSKRFLPLILVYGLFMVILFNNNLQVGGAAFVSVGVAVAYLFMSRSGYYEDKNNSQIFVLSLPISRSKIVLAKYLSIFIYALLGLISYYSAAVIIKLFNLPFTVESITLENMLGMMIGLSFMLSIYLPILFKFGYIKSRIYFMIIFLGFFFLIPVIVDLISEETFPFLNQFVLFIMTKSEIILGVYLGAFALLLIIFSYFLSLTFFRNREF